MRAVILGVLALASCTSGTQPEAPAAGGDATSLPSTIARVPDPRERHLTNLCQLTDGGENAEAYFSFNGQRLIFQSTRPPHECDQIFAMDLTGRLLGLLSTGRGRTTCAYFLPDGKRYLYASTHLANRRTYPRRTSYPLTTNRLGRISIR